MMKTLRLELPRGPSSSSSELSPNSNETSSSNGCGQGCAAPGWKAGISAGDRSTSIVLRS